MSQSREPETTTPAGEAASAGMNQGMRVLSYLIAGVALYGGIGWGADHLLGTSFLLPIGLVAGAALAMYMIIKRFGTLDPAATPGSSTEDTKDKGESVSGWTGLIPMEGYVPPGPDSFAYPPIFAGVPWFDRYMLQALVAFALVLVFWLVMARKRALVPSKGQFVGEAAYMFLRNSVGRDMIGHDFRKYLPFLIALFSFILVNNLWGIVPFTLLPTAAHASWAYGLTAVVWVLYNAIGIKKFGLGGYFKRATIPSGVPGWMLPLIIPLEFLSNILVRPLTLSLRLFANMFAGHLLVLVFVLGGEYLVLESEPLVNKVAGVASWIFSMAIFGLELFVQILQAYIFTVLTAQYISSATADEH